MANPQQTPPAPSAPPADNEARIAQQREEDLRKQASDAAAAAQEAKAGETAAKGELDRALAELATLKATNARLEAQTRQLTEAGTARDGLPTLPVDLPRGAAQLVESVTIATMGEGGKAVRANAKRGDVVFVAKGMADVEELQAAIGLVARVFPVDKGTAEELRNLKHLR